MKSTSCSVFGPPRPHAASPPARTNGIPASCRIPAAFFIAATSSSNVGSGTSPGYPQRRTWNIRPMVRVAAAGDVHASEATRARIEEAFARVEAEADLVLLAGDLTTTGEPEQAAVLADACRGLSIPVCGVLGNHDLHCNRGGEVAELLREAGVNMLDGETAVYEIGGIEVGIVGTKGFIGGF